MVAPTAHTVAAPALLHSLKWVWRSVACVMGVSIFADMTASKIHVASRQHSSSTAKHQQAVL